MNVVIVGPVPGIAPNRVPTGVPRTIGQNDCFNSARFGRISDSRTRVERPHTGQYADQVADQHADERPHQVVRRQCNAEPIPEVDQGLAYV